MIDLTLHRSMISAVWMMAALLPCQIAGADAGAAATASAGREWNQFRGPDRAGIADESGLLRSWPEGGPEVLWRRPLGEGFSGIAVTGEVLYTLFADDENDFAAAFRLADGSELWRRRIGEKFYDEWGNGPRSTPTVDGDLVYVLASLGELWALDRTRGEVRWSLDLGEHYPIAGALPRFASVAPPDARIDPEQFAHATSPLVVDDLLIVYTGHSDGKSLIALDKLTGELRWTALDQLAGYASPTVVTLAGRRQIVGVLHDQVAAVGLDGELLWHFPLGWALTQPILVAPDKILVSAPIDVGATLLAVASHEDGWSVEPVWRNRLLRHAWSTPVVYQGHVYGFDHATLRCLSLATGEVVWARRGLGKGMLVVADGLLIILNDRGRIFLAEASAGGFRQQGELEVLAEPTWTPPTVARGMLLLRNLQEMVALKLKED